MILPSKTYLELFDEVLKDEKQYFINYTTELWTYYDEQPRQWLNMCTKQARQFLIKTDGLNPKTKKPYVNFKAFMRNQIKNQYNKWDRPRDLKSPMSSDEEQNYYQNKRRSRP